MAELGIAVLVKDIVGTGSDRQEQKVTFLLVLWGDKVVEEGQTLVPPSAFSSLG